MKKILYLMIVALLVALQVKAGSVVKDPDLDSIVHRMNGNIFYKDVYLREGNTVSECEYYNWRTQTNDWGHSDKWVYEYTGGLLTKVTDYAWNTSQNAFSETPSWKTEYHYDVQGKEWYEVSYDWDGYLEVWKPEPYSKKEYQYDEAGKVIFDYVYNGDGATSLVNPSSKSEYQYDAQGYLIKVIGYSWLESSNDWAISEEYIYHNDSEGKCTSYERHCGQIVTSTVGMVTISVDYWGLYARFINEYDALGRVKWTQYQRIIYEAKGINDVVDTGRTDTQSNTYYYRNETSIKAASVENAKVIGYYSIMGRKLAEEPESGLYIIQYDNGKTEKKLKTGN